MWILLPEDTNEKNNSKLSKLHNELVALEAEVESGNIIKYEQENTIFDLDPDIRNYYHCIVSKIDNTLFVSEERRNHIRLRKGEYDLLHSNPNYLTQVAAQRTPIRRRRAPKIPQIKNKNYVVAKGDGTVSTVDSLLQSGIFTPAPITPVNEQAENSTPTPTENTSQNNNHLNLFPPAPITPVREKVDVAFVTVTSLAPGLRKMLLCDATDLSTSLRSGINQYGQNKHRLAVYEYEPLDLARGNITPIENTDTIIFVCGIPIKEDDFKARLNSLKEKNPNKEIKVLGWIRHQLAFLVRGENKSHIDCLKSYAEKSGHAYMGDIVENQYIELEACIEKIIPSAQATENRMTP